MPKSTASALSAEAGRRGADVRSDCWVKITPTKSGGIDLQLRTKVAAMYGQSIRQLVHEELTALGVPHAQVEMEDAGALPFVQMARIEAAVRRLGLEGGPGLSAMGGYVPTWQPGAQYPTQRDRFRRSRLYLPGNEPKFMLNAGLHQPDGVILDLEDSVAPPAKDEARLIVRNALRSIDFKGSERMVRINQGDRGVADLDFVVPHNLHVVLIPKVEDPEQVRRVDARIREIQSAAESSSAGPPSPAPGGAADFSPRGAAQAKTRGCASGGGSGAPAEGGGRCAVYLMPIVESALGAIKAYEIATASPNICALTIGLEDYTADIGAQRTDEGRESFWARSQVVNAARAAGVQPIDTVFSDVSDMEGLRQSVLEARSLGFDGKGCIHPRQIAVIHQAFAPSAAELDKAQKIVAAYEEAQAKGLAAVSLGSKMIDPPVVKRAQRVVRLAKALGMLE